MQGIKNWHLRNAAELNLEGLLTARRQRKIKGAALAGLRLNEDPALVRLDDHFGYIKTEPKTATVVFTDLPKALKDRLLHV